MTKKLFTINEVAAALGISAKTLRRWEAKGLLTPHRTIGNQRRYTLSDIEKLTAHHKPSNQPLSKPVLPTPNFIPLPKEPVVIPSPPPAPTPVDFVETSPNSAFEKEKDESRVTFLPHTKVFALSSFLLGFLIVLGLVYYMKPSFLISFFDQNISKISQKASDQAVLQATTKKNDFALRVSVPAEFLKTASIAGKLTAPNIVYNVIPGDNIIISGDPQNPVISSAVPFDTGTGLTLAGAILTNSDPGSGQNIFKNITVGSTTISAGSNNDTLQFAAGSNISLSTNTSTKTITITGTAATGISGITLKESDTPVVNTATILDFLGGDFDLTESPSGEGNISLASTLTSVTGVAGAFTVGGTTTLNGLTYTWPSNQSNGYLLQTNGSGGLSWIDAGSLPNSDKWDSLNGAIYPKNAAVLDLLIGGTSTSSAKFAVTGINGSTTPFASISATTASGGTGTGIILGGNSTIQSLQNSTFTIGGNTTGNIVLSGRNGANNAIYLQGYGAGILHSSSNGMITSSPLNLEGGSNELTGALPVANGGLGAAVSPAGAGEILYSTSTSAFGRLAAGSLNQCLVSGGVAAPSWGNCTLGSGANSWSSTNGAIYPSNSTLDLLVGGVATSSSKFAVLNVNSGTPTASVSAGVSGATFITASGTLATTARQTLTLGDSNTGEIVLDSGNGIIRLADLTANGPLYTSGGNGRLNAEAQLATSRGGTGQDFSGTSQGSLIYFSATGVMSALAPSTANYVLTTQGAGASPQWTDVAGLSGVNFWERASGALFPKIAGVHDLLLGSNATASAKFGFINVNSGTPTATISANVANNYAFLTGAGNLGTTNAQSLTLGGASTGNIALTPANGNGTLALNVGSLTINGDTGQTSVSPTCVSFTHGIVTGSGSCGTGDGGSNWTLNTTNGTIYPINSTMDLLIGGVATASAKFAVLNVAGGTPTASVSAGASGGAFLTASGTLATTARQTLNLGDANTGNIVIDSGNNSIRLADLTTNGVVYTSGGNGTLNTEGQLATSRGGTGQDFSGTAQGNILYFSATGTLSALSPSTANYVLTTQGAGSNPQWTDVTTIAGVNFWDRANGALSPKIASVHDLLLGGNATSSAKFAVLNMNSGTPAASVSATATGLGLSLGGDGTIQSLRNGTITLGGNTTGNIAITPRDGNGALALSVGALTINGATGQTSVSPTCVSFTNGIVTGSGGCGAGAGGSIWTLNTTNGTIYPINNTMDLLIGGVATASAKFAVLNVAGGTPTASVSAGSGGAAFITAQGNLQTTAAQTLTLGGSSTGNIVLSPRDGSGDVRFNGTTTLNGLTYTWPSTQSNNYVLVTNGSGTLTWTDPGSLPAINYWDTANGTLYPKNAAVLDLLIGATATTSAKFAVTGINGSATPFASISATTASGGNGNGITLGGDSSIQSLRNSTLTLGGSTTGNIVLSPRNGSGDVRFNGTTTLNGLTYTWPSTQSNNYVLVTNGSGTLSWTDPGSLPAINYWDRTNGALYPKIAEVHDLLLGSTATATAEFAVTGINDGTPTASLSASTNSNGIYLNASSSTLQSVRNTTLVIGGNTTGNITLSPLNGNGTTTNTGNFNLLSGKMYQIDGNNVLSATTLGSGVITSSLTTVGALGSGSITSGFGAIDIGADNLTAGGTITFSGFTSNGGVLYTDGSGQLAQVTAGTSSQCLIGGSTPSFSACSTVGSNWNSLNGALFPKITSQDLLIGGISSTSALFRVTGNSPFAGTTSVASIAANTSFAGFVVDNRGSGDLFTASSSGKTRFTIKQNGTVHIPGADDTTQLTLESNDIKFNRNSTSYVVNENTESTARLRLGTGDASNTGYGITIMSDKVGINTNTITPRATLDVRNITGTIPIASLSAQTSFAGLIVDNRGSGDLFTASSSGLNRFVITQSGNVGIGTSGPQAGLDLRNAEMRFGVGATTLTNKPTLATDITDVLSLIAVNNGSNNTDYRFYIEDDSTDSFSFWGNSCAGTCNSLTSSSNIMTLQGRGRIGISATSPLATLDVRPHSNGGETIAIASFSGRTSFATLVADNSGSGDIFTASSSGLNRVVIKQNGNVGIGTTNPVDKLEVTGNVRIGNANKLVFGDSTSEYIGEASDTINYVSFHNQDFYIDSNNDGGSTISFRILEGGTPGSGNELFRVNSGGTVGINSNSPQGTLDVRGNPTNGGTIPIAFLSGNTSFAALAVNNTGVGDLFTASASGTTVFRLSNIGEATLKTGVDDYGFIQSNDLVSLSTYLGAVSGGFGTKSNHKLGFFVNDGNYMVTFNVNERVGIGTENPIATLDIRGNTSFLPIASVSGTTSAASLVVDNTGSGDLFTASSSGLNRFIIKQNGNVGIGTNTPTKPLQIRSNQGAFGQVQIINPDTDGEASILFKDGSDADTAAWVVGKSAGGSTDNLGFYYGGLRAVFETDGDAVISGSVASCTIGNGTNPTNCSASDQRLKENITSLGNTAGLDAILKLNAVSYDWNSWMQGNGATSAKQYGFIAQEVANVFPNLVQQDSNSGYYKLDYQGLFAPIVRSIQELNKKIDATHAATLKGLSLNEKGNLNIDSDKIQTQTLNVKGNLETQNLTLGGTNLNAKLIGLESSLASFSAGLANPLTDLQSQMASLSTKVASMEALLTTLTSSNSAMFAPHLNDFTASSGAELNLASLDVNGPIIAKNLNVLTYATINALSVTGDITSGLLSIKGLHKGGSSISTLNGDLKLQDRGLGGIDFLDGLLTIDTTGTLVSKGAITAKKFNIDMTETQSASAGNGKVKTGESTSIVETTSVTPDSLIQVTFTSDYSPATRYWIKTKSTGKSFTIELNQPMSKDTTFNWWIVN